MLVSNDTNSHIEPFMVVRATGECSSLHASRARRRPVSRSSPLAGPALSPDRRTAEEDIGKARFKPSRISSPPNLRTRSYSTSGRTDSINASSDFTRSRATDDSPSTKVERRKSAFVSGKHGGHNIDRDAPPIPAIPTWALGVSADVQLAPDPLIANTYHITPQFSRSSLASGDVILPIHAHHRTLSRETSKFSLWSETSDSPKPPSRRASFFSFGSRKIRQTQSNQSLNLANNSDMSPHPDFVLKAPASMGNLRLGSRANEQDDYQKPRPVRRVNGTIKRAWRKLIGSKKE